MVTRRQAAAAAIIPTAALATPAKPSKQKKEKCMKKRKSNSAEALIISSQRTSDEPSTSSSSDNRSSDSLTLPESSSSSSERTSLADDSMMDHDHEALDVVGTPAALAPQTLARSFNLAPLNIPSTPSDSNGEDSTFRKLNFTTKECATPGRYDARHKLGQPLAVYCRVKPILEKEMEAIQAASVQTPTAASASASSSSQPLESPRVSTDSSSTNLTLPAQIMQLDNETNLTCIAPESSASYRHGETQSKFTFTQVFGPESSQEDVYTHAAKPLVQSFYEGSNGLIFAYGITASGKTYTMQGTKEQPGIIPRIVADLFGKVMEDTVSIVNADGVACDVARFTVKASYLEIYNESIHDLLADPILGKTGKPLKRQACKLQTNNKTDEVTVVNLREVNITDHREAFSLLNQGLANRTNHETLLNSDSSRSHSVFTLKLCHGNGQIWSKLSVVDLAGSERTSRVEHNIIPLGIGASGAGSRMRETVNINQSLLVLGRCLEALKFNQQNPKRQRIVPFRDSQITRLFKDSLSGWGRTVMLTNASQNPFDYDETIHALKYAAIAKEIRVVPRVESIRKVPWTPSSAANVQRSSMMGGVGNTHSRTSGIKRQASQPLQDLDELEHNGSSNGSTGTASAWDNDDDTPLLNGQPSYDQLLDEIFHLKQHNIELELKLGNSELMTRQELTDEHARMMEEMEESFLQRMENEHKKQEEKYKKMFQLWKMEFIEQTQQTGQQGMTMQQQQPQRIVLY